MVLHLVKKISYSLTVVSRNHTQHGEGVALDALMRN
jgi:hypothetical protein